MKITAAIKTMKNIMVGRHPNLSCVYALIINPASCPTNAAFDRPDCHAAEITFAPDVGSYTPKRF